jgi:putative SOS response-associated peptidase YedK
MEMEIFTITHHIECMCGRFTNQTTWRAYHEQLQGFLDEMHHGWKLPAEDPSPRYNLAPTQNAPIIIADGDAGFEGLMARWDFVPWFHKGPLEAKKWSGINARAETITKSGAFREAVKKRRCLVPNNGFIEWKREGKTKIPYWIKPTDTEVSFFAGIWDRWEGVHKDQPVSFISFAIITCEPNSLVAPLHNRMPAILRPEDCQSWIFEECDVALKAIGPYPAQVMSAQKLGTEINNSRNEGAELLAPAE